MTATIMVHDNLIRISDYLDDGWEEAFSTDGPNSSFQVFVNRKTGEVEFVQMNDDGECIRTTLSAADAIIMGSILTNKNNRA